MSMTSLCNFCLRDAVVCCSLKGFMKLECMFCYTQALWTRLSVSNRVCGIFIELPSNTSLTARLRGALLNDGSNTAQAFVTCFERGDVETRLETPRNIHSLSHTALTVINIRGHRFKCTHSKRIIRVSKQGDRTDPHICIHMGHINFK